MCAAEANVVRRVCFLLVHNRETAVVFFLSAMYTSYVQIVKTCLATTLTREDYFEVLRTMFYFLRTRSVR